MHINDIKAFKKMYLFEKQIVRIKTENNKGNTIAEYKSDGHT